MNPFNPPKPEDRRRCLLFGTLAILVAVAPLVLGCVSGARHTPSQQLTAQGSAPEPREDLSAGRTNLAVACRGCG